MRTQPDASGLRNACNKRAVRFTAHRRPVFCIRLSGGRPIDILVLKFRSVRFVNHFAHRLGLWALDPPLPVEHTLQPPICA
jgi:hypothetical protein